MRLILATSLIMRLTGLLKKDRCIRGEVLMLAPCKSIHTFGMRSPIDVAFLDTSAKVLASERTMLPNRMRSHPKAVAALERRSNPEGAWPQVGESLVINFNPREGMAVNEDL